MQSESLEMRLDRRQTQQLPVAPSRERQVLFLLVGGFVLTIVLLALDGFVGLRGAASTRSILGTLTENQQLTKQIETATQRQSLQDRSLLAGCLVAACLIFLTGTRIYYKLGEQSEELSRVSWQLLEKQESLARRLSHELHDELGQSLTALKTNLSRHAASSCSEPSWLEDCTQLVKESMRNAHEISQLLRPTILDDFGLDSALGWLCERFQERNHIEVHYVSDFHHRLEEQAETHLFRIAQEALTNIARHAQASSATVHLSREENTLRLSISDNGVGLSAAQDIGMPTFGLTGMKARARSLSGKMKIRSAVGRGTAIDVSFPLTAPAHDETHSNLVG
jgi:signal transduction histidine kinase